jgi:hypothetical protein
MTLSELFKDSLQQRINAAARLTQGGVNSFKLKGFLLSLTGQHSATQLAQCDDYEFTSEDEEPYYVVGDLVFQVYLRQSGQFSFSVFAVDSEGQVCGGQFGEGLWMDQFIAEKMHEHPDWDFSANKVIAALNTDGPELTRAVDSSAESPQLSAALIGQSNQDPPPTETFGGCTI